MDNYILTNNIVFDAKPDAVPYNYRISYKISQICMIIKKCCKPRSGCSLVKIHIISNALNAKEYQNALYDYVNDKMAFILVRFDPAVNRALKYAISDNLIIQLKNGSYKLTILGKKYMDKVEKEDIMLDEKKFLNQLQFKLTDEKIEQLMGLWRCENAEN